MRNQITAIAILACLLVMGGCAKHEDHLGAADEAKPKADYVVRAAGETVKITVTESGYTPKNIEVKKGTPVKLEFTRTSEEGCGEEVMFESLNIKKPLPIGQPVLIEVTPDKGGELTFVCGMKMLKGTLIVAD